MLRLRILVRRRRPQLLRQLYDPAPRESAPLAGAGFSLQLFGSDPSGLVAISTWRSASESDVPSALLLVTRGLSSAPNSRLQSFLLQRTPGMWTWTKRSCIRRSSCGPRPSTRARGAPPAVFWVMNAQEGPNPRNFAGRPDEASLPADSSSAHWSARGAALVTLPRAALREGRRAPPPTRPQSPSSARTGTRGPAARRSSPPGRSTPRPASGTRCAPP